MALNADPCVTGTLGFASAPPGGHHSGASYPWLAEQIHFRSTAGQGLWVLVFAGACQGTARAGLCLVHHHQQIHFRGLCHWAGELTAARQAAEPPSRRRAAECRVRERQEIEPASFTPTPRTVRNAPSEMACLYAAVFRLSAPLAAHSCKRLVIRSGQSHPVSWTQAQPSDYWDRIATALTGSGHSAAKEEHAPSATLPRTSPLHAIVHRVVRRHTCSPVTQRPTTVQVTNDRRERQKKVRAALGAHVGQPAPTTPSIRSELRGPQRARGPRSACTKAGQSRALFVTKRHKTSRFAYFC